MADLESQNQLEDTNRKEQKETGEISPEQLKQAKDSEKRAEETAKKRVHELVDPMITPHEIAQVRGSIDRFTNIETTQNISDLKEELGKDPDLRLANIPAGSRILTVFQGGPDTLAIKHLNDKVLGMQGTDEIIGKRQEYILQAMQKFGIGGLEKRLANTYKLDKFQLNDEQLASARNTIEKSLSPEELAKLQLSPDPETAHQQILDYILKQAEQKTRDELEMKIALRISHTEEQLRHAEQTSPRDDHLIGEFQKKLTDLKKWHDPAHLRQFTLNFGISQEITTEPGTTEGFGERIFADQQAEAWARVNSQRVEGATYESERRLRGSSYNIEGMTADMIRAESLRADPDLQIFFEDANGQKVLKLDAINTLRKWADFEASNPDPALKAKYEELKQYYRVVNRFDYIKSWVNIEDEKKEVDQKQALLKEGNIEALRSQLKTNPKGTGDMTDAEFHKEAVDMGQARYLILDVVGMGNDNVRSFERVFLAINNRLKTEAGITTSNYQEIKNLTANNPELDVKVRQIFQEEGMKAGNDVTSAFNEKVSLARQKIQNFYRENGYEGKLVSVPGGDEWTVAMPESLIKDERKLQSLLFEIQNATNMRISAARKSVDSNISEDKIRAHKETLKKNETATEFTKKLEKLNINGVFFAQKENGAFSSVLQLPDGPHTIKDADFIWPAVESLQKQGKSPITHADIWNEYQRQITKQPNVEAIAQAA